jgi:hypothetical protein
MSGYYLLSGAESFVGTREKRDRAMWESTKTVFLVLRSQRIDSASLCSPAGRYVNNPIPTRFLAPIHCSKIPAQVAISRWSCRGEGEGVERVKMCGPAPPPPHCKKKVSDFPVPSQDIHYREGEIG